MARAPPEPPSPMTIERIGTFRPNIVLRLLAIASPYYTDKQKNVVLQINQYPPKFKHKRHVLYLSEFLRFKVCVGSRSVDECHDGKTMMVCVIHHP